MLGILLAKGFKGMITKFIKNYWDKCQCWRAYITINKKQISLGLFKNIKDVVTAREEAELKYYGYLRSN